MEALKNLIGHVPVETPRANGIKNSASVTESIKDITGTTTKPLVGSSGLSIQYAILMGLVHDALENHNGKAIKIVEIGRAHV